VVVHFDDFTVDFGSRQLLRGTEAIHLGPKAFELLQLLLKRRPRALSKVELQNQLWPRTVVSESSLTSVVTELRAALGDEARRPRFVRTVYGYGYAFCGEATEIADAVPPITPRGFRLRLFLDDREIALRVGENILGRLDDGVAWLESPTVSRRHARILVSGDQATLEDLGSKNGTRLNGERVRGTRELRDGDAVRLGDVQLLFRCLAFDGSTATERRPVGGR
jgi:DNA-binding winged helix-turn-helix (wHTH) protein